MLIRTYRKRLFISMSLILIIITIITLLTSYYVSRNIMIKEIADTKYRQLSVISDQLTYLYDKAHEYLEFMAHDKELVTAIRELDNFEKNSSYIGASKELREIILSNLMTYKLFRKIYIVSPRNIISENGIETNLASQLKDDISSSYLLKGITDEQVRGYLTSDYQGLFQKNVIITHVDKATAVIGILDFEQLVVEKNEQMLYIFDTENNLIYHDRSNPESLERIKKNTAEIWLSNRNTGIYDKKYLQVKFSKYNRQYKLLLLIDLEQSTKALNYSMHRLIMLSITLYLISLVVLYFVSKFLVQPITKLKEVVTHIRDSLESGELDDFIKRFRKRKKLSTTIYLYSFLTLLPLTAIIAASYLFLKDVIIQEVKQTYSQAIKQMAENMEMRVEGYVNLSKRISFDISLGNILQAYAEGYDKKQEAYMRNQISDVLNKNGILYQDIVSVRLYDHFGSQCYSTIESYDVEKLDDTITNKFSSPYSYSFFNMSDTDEGRGNLYFAIRSTKTSSKQNMFYLLGYLELSVNDFFNEKFTVSEFAPYSIRYLYDKKAWKLINTDATTPYRSLVEGLAQSGLIKAETSKVIRLLEREMLISSSNISGTDWMLIYMIPLENLMNENFKILYYNLILLGTLLFINLALSGIFTISMLRPIKRIQQYLSVDTPDENNIPMPEILDNEVGALAISFQALLQRIYGLTQLIHRKDKERFELERRKNEAQIVALQAQMDPHLMYNIFTTMKILLRAGQSEKLHNMIEATGNFLRNSLLCGEYEVKLSKEIAYVKAYLDIQMIRFSGKLEVNWCYDDENLNECRVPKYLLQPIIENAIVHGMPRERALIIDIHISGNMNELRIDVKDDGIGIKMENLNIIRSMLSESKASAHVGLLNINERIKLYYGSQYDLFIDSEYGVFTCVTVKLPMKKGGDESVQDNHC